MSLWITFEFEQPQLEMVKIVAMKNHEIVHNLSFKNSFPFFNQIKSLEP